MAMTNDLRALIVSRLESIKTEYGIKEISYRIASDDAMYPHVTYDFTSRIPTDMGREDYVLDIHVWGKDQAQAFEILDTYKDLFAFRNDPQESILPTFYETSSGSVDDPDKTIIHLVLRLQGQVYERSTTNTKILERS